MSGDDARARLTEALARLAADPGDVEALIAEARAEARARVKALLVDELADGLLEAVRDELHSRAAVPQAEPKKPEPTPTDSPPAPRPQPSELGWYVYCVVATEDAEPSCEVPGILDGHPTLTVTDGDLAAIVSRVDLAEFDEEPLRERLADMRWLERTARAHESVLDAVGRGATLVPMRLCTIYRDAAGVRAMLARESTGLQHALAYLRGKREWGVKVFADDGAEAPPHPTAQAPSADEGEGEGEGAAYLQARLTDRRAREDGRRRLQDACQAIHDALAAASQDSVSNPVQRPEVAGHDAPMVLNASYLLRDDGLVAFCAERDRLAADYASLGLELELTGPWPPYNFVPGAIGAAW